MIWNFSGELVINFLKFHILFHKLPSNPLPNVFQSFMHIVLDRYLFFVQSRCNSIMYFYFTNLLTNFSGLISIIFYQQIQNYFELLYVTIHSNLHFIAALVSFSFLFLCNISASEEIPFWMGLFSLSLHLFYLPVPES